MFFLNKIFLGIVAGIVVIGGLVVIVARDRSQAPVAQDIPSETRDVAKSSSRRVAPLSGLLDSKEPMSCAYSTTTPTGSSSGNVYISGGKLFGDITVKSTGQEPSDGRVNMIYDGSYFYLWSSLSPQGIKIAATSEGWGGPEGASSLESVWERSNSYDCKPWSADASKFIPPASVQFIDFAQQLQQSIQQGMKNIKASQ